MNYFTHAVRFLDDPYFVAGTAVPDWLRVVNRKVRARANLAAPFADHEDPVTASVAQGIIQHHHDDRWFHQTRAFSELNLEFAVAVRECLQDDAGFRPSFVGHVLVEMLLDAILFEDKIQLLDQYYSVIDSLDPEAVGRAVNRMSNQTTGMLSMFIPRFSAARFLYDYRDDAKLLRRLNNLMQRVGLPLLPAQMLDVIPFARRAVAERQTELLNEAESVL